MMKKATKYGFMIIAAVMLVAMAFAGAGAALNGNPVNLSENPVALDSYQVLVVNDLTGTVEKKVSSELNDGGTRNVYLLEDAADWNAVAIDEETFNGTVLILDADLDFSTTDANYMMTYKFNGLIYGNGKVIKNFENISSGGNIALIRQAGDGLYLNNLQLTNCTSVGAGSNVGILIAEIPANTEVTVIGCSVFEGNVTNHNAGRNGGLIAYVGGKNSKLILNYSKVLNSIIQTINGQSANHAAGLIGRADNGATVNVSNCKVTDCWIYDDYHNGGGIIGTCAADTTSVNLVNCVVSNCSIKSEGENVGGLVGYLQRYVVFSASNCAVLNCNITSGSYGVGGIVGMTQNQAPTIIVADCFVSHSIITGTGSVGGIVGYVSTSSSVVSVSNSTVTECWIEATEDEYRAWPAGGIIGTTSTNKVDKILNCSVKNCIIKSGTYSVGGLVGSAGALNNITDSAVSNCTLLGNSNIGGFVGSLTSTSDWDNNTVSNSSVMGTSNVALDIGNHPGEGEITVLSGYVNQTSLTSPQPRISVVKGDDKPSSDLKTAIAITKLSGIGTLNNLQYACGYVIDSSPLIFNLEVAGKEAYAGAVKVGAHTIAPSSIAGYTFNGWNLSSADGTMLTDATGTLQNEVTGYTNATGYWNNVSGTTVVLYANWTVNQTTKVSENNISVFGNYNYTTVRDNAVISIVLESVNNVTGTVTFTADNTSVSSVLPSIYGMNAPLTVSVFDISAVNDGAGTKSTFNVTITLANTGDEGKVKFFHYTAGSGWDSTPLTSSIVAGSGTGVVTYQVKTDSFSPFGIGLYTPTPTPTPVPQSSSGSRETGKTIILTATPTPVPTATATPSVEPTIVTVKPTAQQTQKSPAPFIGLIAGLGAAAAVLLRLRK